MRTADATRIAEMYARCLLELAQGTADNGQTVERDLDMLEDLLVREPRFQAYLVSPYFSEPAKQELIRNVFGAAVDRLTLNFLLAVVAHHREAVLEQMVHRYIKLSRLRRGLQTVRVTVARPLNDEQRIRLSNDLAVATHAQVDLDVCLDPSIIGGVVIRYADRKVDNSIRGRLHRIRARITHLQQECKEQV